jgi:hypothetical protein
MSEPADPNDRGSRPQWPIVLSLGVLSLGLWLVLVFTAFVAGWEAFLVVAVLGLAALVWLGIRVEGRARLLAVGFLVVGVIAIALASPMAIDEWRHDRTRSEIEGMLCHSSVAGTDPRVVACSVGPVENPSNGNQCGYAATLDISGVAPSEELLRSTTDGVPSFGGLELIPYNVRASGAGSQVTILYIGPSGVDPRCN